MTTSDVRNTSTPRPTGQDLQLTLKVRAFRAFRDDASLELRPLTLLYGQNQAGKSSLVRLVSLISDSLRLGVPALDLKSPALRGAGFKDLGWLGKEPVFTPSWTLAASSKPNCPRITMQYGDERGLFVNSVRVGHGNNEKYFDVRLNGRTTNTAESVAAKYEGTCSGEYWTDTLTFRRLLPDGLPEEAAIVVRDIDDALVTLRRVRWLHANRLADGAFQRLPDGSPDASMFDEPRYRLVLDAASQWLQKQGKLGDEIAIRPDSDNRPRFVIGFTGREHLPLHLAGEGVRALLPVILCACWAEFGRRMGDDSAPTLLAIEEPETNLHPHLHVALFNRLLETVAAGVPVVLETHSVYILRAMQLAVLTGAIAPDQIGLHWVDQSLDGAATITRIEVGADATLGQWMPNAFEKEQELAHEIFDARWKRLENS